jgi:hypothetical protein
VGKFKEKAKPVGGVPKKTGDHELRSREEGIVIP